MMPVMNVYNVLQTVSLMIVTTELEHTEYKVRRFGSRPGYTTFAMNPFSHIKKWGVHRP